MKNIYVLNAVLFLSGVIAAGVGVGVLFVPHLFHGASGIVVPEDVNLLNEMRAPGGLLIAAGVFIIVGAFKSHLAPVAAVVSGVAFLSFGGSRLVSVMLDGMPNSAIIQIMVLELVIGVVCLVALARYRVAD